MTSTQQKENKDAYLSLTKPNNTYDNIFPNLSHSLHVDNSWCKWEQLLLSIDFFKYI